METQEDILKLLSFHKELDIVVVIQTIHPEFVKLEEKVTQEVNEYRSTCNQKTKRSHTSASPDTRLYFAHHKQQLT